MENVSDAYVGLYWIDEKVAISNLPPPPGAGQGPASLPSSSRSSRSERCRGEVLDPGCRVYLDCWIEVDR